MRRKDRDYIYVSVECYKFKMFIIRKRNTNIKILNTKHPISEYNQYI